VSLYRTPNKFSVLYRHQNDKVQGKALFNRATALINYADLLAIMNGTLPLSKRTTYFIFGWFLASGLIRFKAKRGRASNNNIEIGIDKGMLEGLDPNKGYILLSTYRNYNRQFVVSNFAGTQLPPICQILNTVIDHTKQNDKGTVIPFRPPSSQGLEALGVIPKFDSFSDTLAYWLGSLLRKLNEGHHGTSIVVEAIEEHLNKRKMLHLTDIDKFIKKLENLLPDDKLKEILDAQDNDTIPEIEVPDLNPCKRPWKYQWKGVNWMLVAERGILAFDTGLGKTMVSIVFTYIAKQLGLVRGSIVFTKKAVITDFIKEIKAVWPNAKVALVYGTQAQRFDQLNNVADADFVICSYGALSRDMPEMTEFFNENKDMAILFDEGSRIRNLRTNMRKRAEMILADRMFAFILDATPYPNDVLRDSYNLINLLRENQLGTMRAWMKKFSKRVVNTSSRGTAVATYDYDNLGEMRNNIAPFIFIKKEEDNDVDIELPPERHEWDKNFTMGPKQSEWYRNAAERTLRVLIDMINPGNSSYHDPMHLLGALVRQRQCAVTPWLVENSYNYDEVRLDLAVDMLEEWLNSNWKSPVIIGAEFRSVFPRLEQMIIERIPKLEPDMIAELSGKTTSLAESERIKDGINSGKIKVGLLGIIGAGAGINLQSSAHRIILLHKPWNPNHIKQFIARVDRQGQKKRVTVLSLTAENTIDEHIEDVLFRKSYEQDQMLTSDHVEKGGKMSLAELAKLAGADMETLRAAAAAQGIKVKDDEAFSLGLK